MRRLIILGAYCVFLFPLWAHDDPGVMLTGRVIDPSNAVVVGATATLTREGGGKAVQVRTNSQGCYSFEALTPGSWNIAVEAPGFARFTHDGIVLLSGASATFDVALQLPPMAEQVTVTAKAPDFQEALEARDIRESPARDVGEALVNVEGMWKIRKGGIANDVVLRGFQAGDINVLIDGARIFGACPNRMDPPAYHVDFSEIQEVAVTKGAFDVESEGSLGGVVKIINKQPPQGFHVIPNFSTGSFGFINPSVTGSLSNGRTYSSLGYSFRSSDPYTDGNGKRFTSYANYQSSALSQKAFDIQTAWGKLGFTPRENHRIEIAYTRQAGGRTLYPYLMMDALYDDADRLNASYDINHLSPVVRHIQFRGYFTQVDHWMTDQFRTSAVGAPLPYSMATRAKTKAAGGKMDAEISSLLVGVELFRRTWDATNTMWMSGSYVNQPALPDVLMSVAGAYASYRRTSFNRLSVEAGGRLDTVGSEARSPGLNTDLYWAYQGTRMRSNRDTNPAGNVQLAYTLGKGFGFFAGLGHTVRPPDPEERYFNQKRMGSDWVGNPNLLPTKNTELDMGINYGSGRFQVRPTVFYSRLADFITVNDQPRINAVMGVMNTIARSYANVDARLSGGELTYSVGITRSLLWLGGTSYSVGSERPEPTHNIFSTHLAEMPPLKTHAALRYGTRVFFGEINAMAVDAQNRVDTDLNELRTPGYTTFGVKVGVHTKKLNLATGINNVLNRFYYEHFSYLRDPFRLGNKVPEPGRNVFLTASYDF